MSHPQVLRDLALFVEVAKRKSFSRAADALDMPISSLSRRITQFEATIGVRLLDRTTRKLALTAYGEAYLVQATRVVEEAQRSFEDLVAQAKGPSGHLTVAVPTDFWVTQHLSGIASDFARQHAQVHVHLDLRSGPVDLIQESYDLAICTEVPREASLIVRKVGALENGLFAAPDYLRARGRPEHPRDLGGHEVLLTGASAAWPLSRGTQTHTAEVSGRLSCSSLSLVRHLALAGRGIAALSLSDAGLDLEAGRLERILDGWSLPPTEVFVVTTSRLVPAKVRGFIDFLVQRLGTAFAEGRRTADPAASRSAAG
ncbi:LysR family transcriptional regulator [Methylobacterium dankookense]|uniref:HTH-type transcriptional regulator DmlR n=1 Tax=Methylobacterium dankookense TaxID=560405 RepID=A0A564FU79_9HYPH|nr:LysR family transcriptional regulator [Methylobacterium dankookense]GJD56779.1 HTH-type transcriptional regulator DmlR [Methylobacterium dankookense]VUF11719.1 HTH-type transcriptional regulator DmlR [Methylobacterium dankookense]